MADFFQTVYQNIFYPWMNSYLSPQFISWAGHNLLKTMMLFIGVWLFLKIILFVIKKMALKCDYAKIGISKDTGTMLIDSGKILLVYGSYMMAAVFSLQFFGLNIIEKLNLLVFAGISLKIMGIVIVGRLLVVFGRAGIDHLFRKPEESNFLGEEKRIATLRVLMKSILFYVVSFIAFIMILGTLGVQTASLLASAGIIGLAIGFGAQNLVRDIITGFFIIFENYFTVGDYINVAGVGGVVEEMGLRTTKIRDWAGELHIIPNGEISMVTNHCRGKMRAMVDVSIAYEEDIGQAIKVLQKAADQITDEYRDRIVDHFEVLGVQDLGASEVVIRVWGYTKPMEQWEIERALRKKLKEALDEGGIQIPYPHLVVLNNGSGAEEG